MSRGGENEDPTWLTESTTAAAVAVGSNKEVQKAVKNAATDHVKEKYLPGGGSSAEDKDRALEAQARLAEYEATINPEDLVMMKKWKIILQISFAVVAIAMAAVAIFRLFTYPDIEIFFLGSYVIVFAILVLCFECGLPGISSCLAVNFGFLYSMAGRLVFCLFVGFLCFSLKIWGIICGSAMMGVLMVNIYVLCTYPKYEPWLRRKHYER